MADRGKEFPLSIVLRTVDRATAGLKQANDRIERQFKPYKEFGQELSKFSENLGLPKLRSAFARVGQEIASLARQLGGLALGAVAAVYGFKRIVDSFDALGDKAERMAVSADFLAQLRYAAQRSGAEVEELDSGLTTFTKSLGQARAGTGRLASFLGRVSPALLKQVKAAKSNEEAFDLLADAMAKVQDPAKRAALATAAFGGSGVALAPLLSKGSKGIGDLRKRYVELAGSQEDAVDVAGRIDDSAHDITAAIDGVKASLVVGLGPAFLQLMERVKKFFTENRERISAWIADFGEKLPGRINAFIGFMERLASAIKDVWNFLGGAKGVLIAFAAVKLAGLVSSVLSLVGALTRVVAGLRAASAAGGAAGAPGVGGGGAGKAGGALGVVAAAVGGYEIGKSLDKEFNLSDRIAGVNKFNTEGLTGIDKEIAVAMERSRQYGDPKLAQYVEMLVQKKRAMEGEDLGLSPPIAGDVTGPASPAPAVTDGSTPQAHVTVDFANAPKGTRVQTDPQSTADVELSVGWQMETP